MKKIFVGDQTNRFSFLIQQFVPSLTVHTIQALAVFAKKNIR